MLLKIFYRKGLFKIGLNIQIIQLYWVSIIYQELCSEIDIFRPIFYHLSIICDLLVYLVSWFTASWLPGAYKLFQLIKFQTVLPFNVFVMKCGNNLVHPQTRRTITLGSHGREFTNSSLLLRQLYDNHDATNTRLLKEQLYSKLILFFPLKTIISLSSPSFISRRKQWSSSRTLVLTMTEYSVLKFLSLRFLICKIKRPY